MAQTAERRREADRARRAAAAIAAPDTVPCPICDVPVRSRGLGSHNRNLHPASVQTFRCLICNRKCLSEESLERHCNKSHGGLGMEEMTSRRARRYAFVQSIAHLPYPEFLDAIMAPWE